MIYTFYRNFAHVQIEEIMMQVDVIVSTTTYMIVTIAHVLQV